MIDTSTRSLYDRLGGGAGCRAVVDRLCELVLADPTLRPWFADVDTLGLRRRVALFLGEVAGGPGDPHPTPGARRMDDAAFDRVTFYLAAALHERRISAREIDQLLIAARALRELLP